MEYYHTSSTSECRPVRGSVSFDSGSDSDSLSDYIELMVYNKWHTRGYSIDYSKLGHNNYTYTAKVGTLYFIYIYQLHSSNRRGLHVTSQSTNVQRRSAKLLLALKEINDSMRMRILRCVTPTTSRALAGHIAIILCAVHV